jgi:peptide chain release factor 2
MILRRDSKAYGGFFDPARFNSRLKEIEEISGDAAFWNDRDRSQKMMSERKDIETRLKTWNDLEQRFNDLSELLELYASDSLEYVSLKTDAEKFDADLSSFELRQVLSEPHDKAGCFFEIHSGAGGTEACDWAEMLLRMYLRWCEISNYKTSVLEITSGDEAGIKSVTVEVDGDYAYGYLKCEIGIHRLVRLSPFDSNHRRHTSFASLFAYPQISADETVEINDKDLRIDTYRASGHGGQHINKTDSAVRITHIPTNTVVQCQSERSQFQNKARAMQVLMARIKQKIDEEKAVERAELESKKKKIEWGSQIRSYVLHPYNMVKDLRTGYETSNTKAVLDGELDGFIRSYLLSGEPNVQFTEE